MSSATYMSLLEIKTVLPSARTSGYFEFDEILTGIAICVVVNVVVSNTIILELLLPIPIKYTLLFIKARLNALNVLSSI